MKIETNDAPLVTIPVRATDPAEQLVLENLALAQSIARRYSQRQRDEDLVQVAYIGLLKAARRFDPEKGPSFAAFAVPTIAGEIKRHLRDHGWFVRPPRSVQDLRARIAEATPRLSQKLGRRPSVAELSIDLDASAGLVREALDCEQHLQPASLDVSVGSERDSTLADLISDGEGRLEQAELWALLWSASRALTPRERRIVHLRYFEDRTQQDIAQEIGVTQMQISRILTKAMAILRDRITNGDPARRTRTA